MGWEGGYRHSWECATGQVTEQVFTTTTGAGRVTTASIPPSSPGVLLCNRADHGRRSPRLVDIPASVMRLFGQEIPRYMQGEMIFPEEFLRRLRCGACSTRRPARAERCGPGSAGLPRGRAQRRAVGHEWGLRPVALAGRFSRCAATLLLGGAGGRRFGRARRVRDGGGRDGSGDPRAHDGSEGEMPNFSKLAREGTYQTLGTSDPAAEPGGLVQLRDRDESRRARDLRLHPPRSGDLQADLVGDASRGRPGLRRSTSSAT